MNTSNYSRKQFQTIAYEDEGASSESFSNENTKSDPILGNGLHKTGFTWSRLFSRVESGPEITAHPYDEIEWDKRTAKIVKGDGTVVFEQNNVEVPSFWTQTATDIVASKYFRGRMNSPEREYSAKQMIDRVSDNIAKWGVKDGYFATSEDAE